MQLFLSFIELLKALLLLRLQLQLVSLDRLVLLADQLQFLRLHRASLFIFLMRRTYCAQHLLIDVAKVAADLILLKVFEHLLEIILSN